jgi:hypothetical protein
MPDENNNPAASNTTTKARTGGFRAAKKLFGIRWPRHPYIPTWQIVQFEKLFGDSYFFENNGLHMIQLDSHNAFYVLQAHLTTLCNLWNIERISVVDMSDWTVREFVLDEESNTQ